MGPHGFGGKYTALDVKIDYAYRHPATYAIGVVVSCWATRRSVMFVDSTGEWRIESKHLVPRDGECVEVA